MAEPTAPPPAGIDLSAYEEYVRTHERVAKEIAGTSESFRKLSSSNVDIIKSFSELGRQTNSVVDQLGNFATAIGELGTLEGFANMLNLAADKLLKNSQELATALDKSRASYIKETGDIAGYGSTMDDIMYKASSSIAIFGTDVSKAASLVRSSFPFMVGEMNKMGEAQQKNVAGTAALITKFELLGISSATTTKSISSMRSAMIGNGTAVRDLDASMKAAADTVALTTLELNSMGYTLQESAAIISENTDLTIVFGQDALKALAATAKQTQIALSDLVAVSDKFDSFEGAAEHVGKLNALLGSDYLGVTEMMFAEPAEQVKMISGAFEQAGLTAASLDSMTEAEKKFHLITIQSTLGLKSKEDALKFLNADEFKRADMLEKQAEKEQKNIEVQDKLNDILIASLPIMESLENTFKSLFSAMEPLFTMLNKALAWINELVAAFNKWQATLEGWQKTLLGVLELVILVGGSLLLTWVAVFVGLMATLGPTIATLATAAPAIAALAPAIAALGAAATSTAGGLLAFGAAVLMVGAGIGLAAFGLSYFVAAFAGLAPAQLLAASIGLIAFGVGMYFLIGAIAAIAVTMTAAWAPLLAFAAVMLAIGVSVLFAALGISMIVKAFGGLAEAVLPLANVLKDIVLGLASVIGDIILGSLDKISNIFVSLSKLSFSGLMGIAGGLAAIAAEIISFPDKTININFKVTGDTAALESLDKLSSVYSASARAGTPQAVTEKTIKVEIKEIYLRFENSDPLKAFIDQEIVATLKKYEVMPKLTGS